MNKFPLWAIVCAILPLSSCANCDSSCPLPDGSSLEEALSSSSTSSWSYSYSPVYDCFEGTYELNLVYYPGDDVIWGYNYFTIQFYYSGRMDMFWESTKDGAIFETGTFTTTYKRELNAEWYYGAWTHVIHYQSYRKSEDPFSFSVLGCSKDDGRVECQLEGFFPCEGGEQFCAAWLHWKRSPNQPFRRNA